MDFTSYMAPKGGINKDSLDSNHGKNHTKAANVAIAATSELLEDVRRTAGDTSFLLYETILHVSVTVYVL